MSSRASSRSTRVLIVLGFLLSALVALFALRVGTASYRAVRHDFEPWPASEILHHPQLTGIATLQAVSFRSVDNLRIAAWYVPSANRAAIVLTHGTNGDRSSMLAEMRILADAGYGVLAFDWPGDGESDGTVHWNEFERHALFAAINWLSQRPEVDPKKIGGLGFSMGGYIMAQAAAADTRLSAVILEATPDDLIEYTYLAHRRWGVLSEWPATVALRSYAVELSTMSPKALVAAIAPRHLLILGGNVDNVVPPQMTRQLYAAASDPKELWIVSGAHHGGYAQVPEAHYGARIVAFFARYLLQSI